MAFVIFPQMAPYVAAPDMRLCEPVSVTYRAGLRHVETEIGKWRAETDARKPPARDRKLKFAGQRLGHARMRSRIPVPVDTFRCSLFALEFPPNDPTRTGEGLQKGRG